MKRLVALLAVSTAAAAGCARLFDGAGWVVPAMIAVAGAHGVGVVTRRWPVGAVVAGQGAGLLVLLAERVGGHTAYGVPTPASFTALARAAGRAPEAFRAAIVPAPTSPELVLLVVGGLWIAVAAADGLARRRRAGLLAVVPLTAFPVVVAALGTGRGRVPLTFAFAAATALYAALDRRAALPGIEAAPLRPGPAGGSRCRRGVLGLAGPALAVGAAAVVLGPVMPGIGRAVVDVHAFGVTLDVSRVELNPLVDIQPQLLTDRRTELFTVRSAAPAYWRLTALDRFDGRRWSPSRPALYRQDGFGGGDAVAENEALRQDFSLTALDSPWLPAAGRAIRVRAAGAGARLDPETDSLVTKKGSRFVRAYRVESHLPPDPGEQRPSAAGAALEQPVSVARYLSLPRNFPRAVRELAQRFTAGATTPYQRAVALEDSLRVGFIYDESAPPGASVNALTDFLLRSRRGFCEQFAGAYAAMARALGLPARVAVGFTPGAYDTTTGLWRVTTREAHAWPEVFLAGLGWTPFEPTPGRVLPDPDARVRPSDTVERLAAARTAGGVATAALARIDPGGGAGVDAGPGGRAGGLAGAVTHRRTVWWVSAAALGLLAVAPAAKTRRRNARRRAPAGEAVLGAWSEALDRLGEAGLARRGEETPLEFAGRAGGSRPGVAPALRHLAVLVNGAAYGTAAGANDGRDAWAASDRIVRAIDAHDPRWMRWRRRLDPRPLLRR
jgi:transglutaminase-like putative cysteine protease